MRFLIDFFPIGLFVAVYFFLGKIALALHLSDMPIFQEDNKIYVATVVLMVATVLQTIIIYALDHKLSNMHKITLLLVVGFGTATLVFHDKRFIMWKPTVLYALFAMVLAFGLLVKKQNYLKLFLSSQLSLPDAIWTNLNFAWIGYFLFMSALNSAAVILLTEAQWFYFKFWGYVFPIVFIVGQGLYIARYLKDDGSAADGEQKP